MKRLIWAPGLAAAALAAATLYSPASARADGTAPTHLTWCSTLTDELRNQTLAGLTTNAAGKPLNSYLSERTILFAQDGNPFTENRTLCNQHVLIQFRHAYGWNDAAIKAKFGATWANAETLYNDIMTNKGFARVNSVFDIQPGDTFAFSYRDDPNSGYPSVTGHTGFINSIGPIYTHTFTSNGLTVRYRDLEVFDSANSGHSLDTRSFLAGQLGPGSPHTEWSGAGRGYMRIYVDANGEYLGYTWSMTGTKTQAPGTPPSWNYYNNNYKPESLRHFAVGRVTVP